jgi:N-acetyl-anhydromuramyl-L-alanine amidase AmpD
MDLSRIKKIDFPENQYYKEECPKSQIYLHHTVSGDGYDGDVNTWKNNPERVATCVVVERNGDIIQCFSSKYWAHHLGVTSQVLQRMGYPLSRNLEINKGSIGIEIDSWGGLAKDVDGKFYPAKWDVVFKKFIPNKNVKAIPAENVVEFPTGFRGFYAFEKYTDAQLASVKDLITYWSGVYNIPTTYNADIFDVTRRCFDKEAGIFSHVSCRSDKSDCSPQEALIEMLKSL